MKENFPTSKEIFENNQSRSGEEIRLFGSGATYIHNEQGELVPVPTERQLADMRDEMERALKREVIEVGESTELSQLERLKLMPNAEDVVGIDVERLQLSEYGRQGLFMYDGKPESITETINRLSEKFPRSEVMCFITKAILEQEAKSLGMYTESNFFKTKDVSGYDMKINGMDGHLDFQLTDKSWPIEVDGKFFQLPGPALRVYKNSLADVDIKGDDIRADIFQACETDYGVKLPGYFLILDDGHSIKRSSDIPPVEPKVMYHAKEKPLPGS